MALFLPRHSGALGDMREFTLRMAGAESNVSIGLARLGFRTGWCGRLGSDEFGRFIIKSLRAEGVDVSAVTRDESAPTGLITRELAGARDPRVFYYRSGSAASRMGSEHLRPEYIATSRLLHVTGITAALSASCRQSLSAAIRMAREGGASIALDPNLRLKLWSAEEATAFLQPLMGEVDLVLVGLEEGERLSGRQGEEAVAAWCLEAGARLVVMKLGSRGAMATDGSTVWKHPGFAVTVTDTVGAGDAFAAGFYAGWLEGRPMEACLRMGNATGALAVQTVGDIEGLPYREDLLAFLGETEITTR